MIQGLDSAFPPNDSQLQQMAASGIKVYFGYTGQGAYHDWLPEDFARVRASGITPLVYAFPAADPTAAAQFAKSVGARLAIDNARGDTPNPFAAGILSWLNAAKLVLGQVGMYGQNDVLAYWAGHFGFAISANPAASDPGTNDPPGLNLGVPTGWQWWHTHTEFGMSVDRGNYDDWFGGDTMDSLSVATSVMNAHYEAVAGRPLDADGGGWVAQLKQAYDNNNSTQVEEVLQAFSTAVGNTIGDRVTALEKASGTPPPDEATLEARVTDLEKFQKNVKDA